jgi:hypothetical protein
MTNLTADLAISLKKVYETHIPRNWNDKKWSKRSRAEPACGMYSNIYTI